MIRIFLPLICAALGLAAASCTQSEEPLAPADAPASPHATPHSAPSAAMASAPDSSPTPSSDEAATPGQQALPAQTPTSTSQPAPEATADEAMPADRRASTLIGMPVVSSKGDPLGQVKDIIFDPQGRAAHLVIAYDTQPQSSGAAMPDDGGKPASASDGRLTAMPWDAALASIKEGRLVLDEAKLQGAPSFTPDAWPNLDDPSWSADADSYWRKAVRAAIAAHPGNPIDPTARQRTRPNRDGEDE